MERNVYCKNVCIYSLKLIGNRHVGVELWMTSKRCRGDIQFTILVKYNILYIYLINNVYCEFIFIVLQSFSRRSVTTNSRRFTRHASAIFNNTVLSIAFRYSCRESTCYIRNVLSLPTTNGLLLTARRFIKIRALAPNAAPAVTVGTSAL